jgi:hypothetical protein
MHAARRSASRKLKAMPLLCNPRHEKFAQALAEGKSATEAYEVAGYTPNDGNAARMKGNDRVRERVAELQEQGAERSVVTLEALIAEAGDIQTKALAKGHYSAAVSALTVKAKLSGHWVDRGENKTSNVIYAISDRELTEEEWDEKYCRPLDAFPMMQRR